MTLYYSSTSNISIRNSLLSLDNLHSFKQIGSTISFSATIIKLVHSDMLLINMIVMFSKSSLLHPMEL